LYDVAAASAAAAGRPAVSAPVSTVLIVLLL
jgi:hypothetical protein